MIKTANNTIATVAAYDVWGNLTTMVMFLLIDCVWGNHRTVSSGTQEISPNVLPVLMAITEIMLTSSAMLTLMDAKYICLDLTVNNAILATFSLILNAIRPTWNVLTMMPITCAEGVLLDLCHLGIYVCITILIAFSMGSTESALGLLQDGWFRMEWARPRKDTMKHSWVEENKWEVAPARLT